MNTRVAGAAAQRLVIVRRLSVDRSGDGASVRASGVTRPLAGACGDDCFCRPALAEPTIELATKRNFATERR